MNQVKTQVFKIADLNPAKYNPRVALKPGDPEFERLCKSIQTFGYVELIVVNVKNNNTVISGHQRLSALKYLGETEVECVVVELDEDEEKTLNIAMNKISGSFDEVKLKDLLKEIDLSDLDTTLTGFSDEELKKLIGDVDLEEVVADDKFDEDAAVEEAKANTRSHRGCIWQLGDHRLMCGDSTSPEDVGRLMDGALCDMVFTDPPWNVDYGGSSHPSWKQRSIKNDNMTTEDFKNFMGAVFANMNNYSKPGAMTYVVMSAQEWGNLMLTLKDNEYHWSSTVIWNKDHLVLSRKDYHTKYEPIWYGWKEGEARLHPLDDRTQSDVWDFDRPTKSEEHPTMKPIPLVARAIQNSSNRGDLVLDLFGGSGTTVMAAEQTKRRCYAMELDEVYCDVIVKRWEEYTGKTAVMLEE